MMGNEPFLLKPAAKDYLWGGSRLNDFFGKQIDLTPLAETWECSTHPEGQSVVASGVFCGELLGDVLAKHPEYLGTHSLRMTGGRAELPILIKLIDAREDLSVQVHPDDVYASVHEHSLGKAEMWYVLQTTQNARLVHGFRRNMNKTRLRHAVKQGTIRRYLNQVPVKKNDLFFIEPGTVHALGAGTLVAEVQENSNVTYRLFDYDRVDQFGNKRELHLEKALDVVNLAASAAPRQPMRVLRYHKGCATELLTRCKYFQVERMLLNTEIQRDMSDFRTQSNSFHALLCTDGCGCLIGEEQKVFINFFKGDCLFIPANSIRLKLHGRAQLLNVTC